LSLDSLAEIQARLKEFAGTRDWGQFHTPKNLCCALSVEAAELLEIFQWERSDENRALSEDDRTRVSEEMADVLFYLVMLADSLAIDLPKAAAAKLAKNELKYPAELSRGRSTKYTELER
jgi:dCTP diphosphatase